jgi:hypothetical protein
MKATKTWSVRFEGSLDEGARRVLESAAGVGDVTSDGDRRHRVLANGATAEAAIARVKATLDAHGSFSGFEAEPSGE